MAIEMIVAMGVVLLVCIAGALFGDKSATVELQACKPETADNDFNPRDGKIKTVEVREGDRLFGGMVHVVKISGDTVTLKCEKDFVDETGDAGILFEASAGESIELTPADEKVAETKPTLHISVA